MEYRPSTNITNLYIHTNIYRAHTQKQDWKRRLRDEDKKENKLVKNNEIYYICVGKNTMETHQKLVQKHRIRRIRARTCSGGWLDYVKCNTYRGKIPRQKIH
jgi:hypothetical protein